MADILTRHRAEVGTPSDHIREAVQGVPQSGFVAPDISLRPQPHGPLPIGFGQTIGQLQTAEFMLELLQPGEGDVILDIGAGSGWTAAVLAQIVGPDGKVYAVELIPQLVASAKRNLVRFGIEGVEIIQGNGISGLAMYAPFDRIHVAAAIPEISPDLKNQLAIGGRLVTPVGEFVQDVVLVERISPTEFRERHYPGFQFVHLVPST